ncbi:hypothetical protein [Fonticella tunisiensis]|uniref:Uncharacterized protein n=1 Tax=Fonticella tunisiensis TaxID=1096341 RepID=A0A4R7KTV1_9CLOT|nr:hypothetical protein [Fonticella tunisiensis]TDT63463.1 hypothetical protein EDD71_102225 [Fonticella tunisiensis]
MIKREYGSSTEYRDINRSPHRNMPKSCAYCGYRYRPSSSGYSCTIYCIKYMKQLNKKY